MFLFNFIGPGVFGPVFRMTHIHTCPGPSSGSAIKGELLAERVETDTALLDKGVMWTVDRWDLYTPVAPLTTLGQVAQRARVSKRCVTVL